jgi:hypothetical protein
MSEGSIPQNQSATMERAIRFLQASSLVTKMDGVPALTSKGEMFLQEFEEFWRSRSPGSSGLSVSIDELDRPEETNQR